MELLPLTPKQAASIRLARESRIAIWEGSVRSSKTIVSLLAWAEFIASAPDGLLLMAGKTLDTLRRNVIAPLEELLGQRHVDVKWGTGEATILGKRVLLVGADNAAAESRIRGLTLAGAYVDELSIIGGPHGAEWWKMLLSRMSVDGARILATTNPDSPSHWLLEDYLRHAVLTVTQDGRVERHEEGKAALGLHRYRFVIDDNSALSPAFVEAMKAEQAGVFYKRFIEGLWVAAEGAVYPMLDRAVHECPIPEGAEFTSLTLGVDHGVTNPTHAVLLGLVSSAKADALPTVWVLGEHRLTDATLTVAEQAERLWAWLDSKLPQGEQVRRGVPVRRESVRLVVDPAAKAMRNELHRVSGAWPWQADNAVVPGISDVSALLQANRLLFAEGECPHLLRELSGYVWDPAAQKRGLDAPLKRDDHGPDALRYAVRALLPSWRRS